MPFNGSGTYNPISTPDFPAVPGTTIRSAQYNNQINDMAAALSLCVTRDGQSLPTVDLPMTGFTFTGLRAPAAPSEPLRHAQIEKGTTLASAAALVIPEEGNLFEVSGTTAITSFSGVTIGRVVYLMFQDVVALTASVNLLLPTGVTTNTVAGDIIGAIQTSAGVWEVITWPDLYLTRAGGAIYGDIVTSAGLRFSSPAATSAFDLSKHIALLSTTHGINVTTDNAVNYNSAGNHRMLIGATAAFTVDNTSLYYKAQQVWHAGTFDPNSKLSKTGGAMTGPIDMANNTAYRTYTTTGNPIASLYMNAANQLIVGGAGINTVMVSASGPYINSVSNYVWHQGLVTQVLASAGYMKYPNGFMEQWSTVSVAGDTTTTVLLPTAFPSACVNAMANALGVPQGMVNAFPASNSSVTLSNFSPSAQNIAFRAIGF